MEKSKCKALFLKMEVIKDGVTIVLQVLGLFMDDV